MSIDNPNGKMYAVYRNGARVSETEYPDPFFAQKELEHWKNIIKRNPDGSRVEIKPVKPQPENQ